MREFELLFKHRFNRMHTSHTTVQSVSRNLSVRFTPITGIEIPITPSAPTQQPVNHRPTRHDRPNLKQFNKLAKQLFNHPCRIAVRFGLHTHALQKT